MSFKTCGISQVEEKEFLESNQVVKQSVWGLQNLIREGSKKVVTKYLQKALTLNSEEIKGHCLGIPLSSQGRFLLKVQCVHLWHEKNYLDKGSFQGQCQADNQPVKEQ